jgi:predicted dienelactone hydrolase
MIRALLACTGMLLTAPAPALTATAQGTAVEVAETPELGRPGAMPVGTRYRELALAPRPVITPRGPHVRPRNVGLRLWYPASAKGRTSTIYRHTMTGLDGARTGIVEYGAAFESVGIAAGRFPLVVVSHGFGGWSEHLSRLGEHLASRGYIVASIDHRDAHYADLPGFLLSFGNVLVDRSLDQREVIGRLLDPQFAQTDPALAAIDPAKVGLIGYSMGGYGALATGGAAYDLAGKPFAQMSGGSRRAIGTPDPGTAARIKALVAIAPWGGQPDNRAWSAASLAALTQPVLIIGGDHDDVVNFRQGVRWIFDALKGTTRRMLVYREAKHNVAGNAVSFGGTASYEAMGYAADPVWRQDRINQINQHFITAFLDATLKHDASASAYLDVPTPVAADGSWPMAFGERYTGTFADATQPGYWRGFQRGSATGLELLRKAAGQ